MTDLDRPAVDAFLGAVDTVMNSNTFLLKARADVPVTQANQGETLRSFLHDPLFHDMMLAADRMRDWWNLQPSPFELPDDSSTDTAAAVSPLVPDGIHLDLRTLDVVAFATRLRWMLCEVFSPYRQHLEAERADAVLEGFFGQLFGPGSWDPSTTAERFWSEAGWSFSAVRPDFLYSTEYYTDVPRPKLAYFDGGDNDTATLFHRGDVFYLLLTNGSP